MITETTLKPVTLTLTTVFNQIMQAWLSGKRRAFLEGGTECSKTYSVMQLLKLILENYKEPILATVTSESMPHLKTGAMRDFLAIMGDEMMDGQWNKTDFIYTWPQSGCQLEYISADHESRFLGGRREILFCNEVNHIKRNVFRQADMRTKLFTICDWNPESAFWFHEEKLAEEAENVYIHATYMDTLEILTPQKRAEIEAWEKKDPNWWNVYGLGLIGKIEGLVYSQFSQVDELPDGDCFYGLDYGYSSDPTVLVKNVLKGDNLYSHEMFYSSTPMTNDDISRELTYLKVSTSDPIYPDPNEPKSAEELRRKGYNIKETEKGKGSVKFGIKRVNQYNQYWTKDSGNCIKEQRNFRYIQDDDGSFTDKTTHRWSHGMDARRYGVASYIPTTSSKQKAVSYM